MKKINKKIILFFIMLALVIFSAFSTYGFSTAKASQNRVDVIISLHRQPISLSYDTNKYESVSEFLATKKGISISQSIQNDIDACLSKIQNTTDFTVDKTYSLLTCGFSGSVSENYINKIKEYDFVKSVFVSTKHCYAQSSLESNTKALQSLSDKTNVKLNTKDIKNATYSAKNSFYAQADDLEYDGGGMLVGVLDTSLSIDHKAFSVMPAAFVSNNDIADVLPNLNAYKINSNITTDDVYKSKKIAFAFDYAQGDTDVYHEYPYTNILDNGHVDIGHVYTSHGTFVSGLLAGNCDEFTGVAPQAQIAFARVFDENLRAQDSVVISAMEDMVLLGADVVNLSLGTPCGNSIDSLFSTLIDNADRLGTLFCFAAGNSNVTGTYAQNPDNGTINSAGSLYNAFAVGNFDSNGKKGDGSAYGPSPALDIKPDVSAVGTQVYGPVDEKVNIGDEELNNGYAAMSGTSMATPKVSGALTLIKQKLLFLDYPVSQINAMAKQILMSTADVAIDYISDSGVAIPYSPRVQGAGIINIKKALQSIDLLGYLKAENSGYAKINAGDDKTKSGIISSSFIVNNSTSTEKTYKLSSQIFTETYSLRANEEVMSLQSRLLNPTVTFYVDGVQCNDVRLYANTEQKVDVKIELSDADKQYLDLFPNGMYVEGFIYVQSDKDNAQTKLNIPLLAYYGDWEKDIPQFDDLRYGNNIYSGTTVEYRHGDGEYVQLNTGKYKDASAISYFEKPTEFVVSTTFIRNVNQVQISISDYHSSQILYATDWMDGGVKYNNQNTEQYEYKFTIDFAQVFGKNFIVNNRKFNINLYGKGDYGQGQSLNIPFIIDIESPSISDVEFEQGESLTVLTAKFIDNHSASNMYVMTKQGNEYTILTGGMPQPNEKYLFDLTDKYNNEEVLYLKSVDVSGNFSIYEYNLSSKSLALVEKSSAKEVASVTDVQINYAHTETEDGATYAYTNDGIVLVSYQGDAEFFEIKEGVIRVESNAFYGSKIKKVSFPSTLISIGDKAFYQSDLQTIESYAKVAPVLEYSYVNLSSEGEYLNFPNGIVINNYGKAQNYDKDEWKLFATTKEYFSLTFFDEEQKLDEIYVEVGSAFNIQTLTKKGYKFDGWYLDKEFSQLYDDEQTIDGDLVLYASWEKIKKLPAIVSVIAIIVAILVVTLCVFAIYTIIKRKETHY